MSPQPKMYKVYVSVVCRPDDWASTSYPLSTESAGVGVGGAEGGAPTCHSYRVTSSRSSGKIIKRNGLYNPPISVLGKTVGPKSRHSNKNTLP
jgi:hypothetical protein